MTTARLFVAICLMTLMAPSVSVAQRAPVITLTRGIGCTIIDSDPTTLNGCPDYNVSIFDDGTVVYVGRRAVRTVGERTHRIPPEAVRDLLQQFRDAGFLTLRDRYDSVESNGSITFTSDLTATTLTANLDGIIKSVYDYDGTPDVVRRLEERVDLVSGISRYTGR